MIKLNHSTFIITILFLVISPNLLANQTEFKSFKTDLCTSYPEGTRQSPMLWAHCCIKHDMAYWVAGDRVDLKRADLALKECVTEVAGAFQGNLMYQGIRAGHYFPIKSRYRWGWAWPKNRRRYTPLSQPELDLVLSVIYDQEGIDPEILEDFIDFRF
jgi:hypothetical protein